jgi:hypothetical protein
MLLWKRRENAAGASSRPPSWARLPAGQTQSVLRIRFGFNADTDPDPAFFFINVDPDPDPGFWWQILGKIYSWKIFFLIKTCNFSYLSLGLHKGRLSFNRILHPSKENFWHFKTWVFFTFVGNFGPPGSGSGFVFPMQIRIRIQLTKINADPDLDSQHWTQFIFGIFDLLRRVFLCIWNN